MTKNEIALWWKLMEAKAELRFQRALNIYIWNSCQEQMIERDYAAEFWMRVQEWERGE